jgi:hypothetical protein
MILKRHVYEVEISGVHYICKLAGGDYASFERELAVLQKLEECPIYRTSRLKGFIGLGSEFP